MELYKGDFYYPENPDNQVAGILTIDDHKNIELELLGALSDFFDKNTPQGSTIYGDLFNGKKVTLLYCTSKNFELRFGVSQLEQFKAKFLLIGTHVPTDDKLYFNEITISINQLAEWLNITGSRLSFEEGFKNLTFKYNQPENIEFKINDELTGAFFFRQKYPLHAHNFKLEEKTLFSISSDQPKSLSQMIAFIWDFRKLLSFFVGTKTKINQLVLISHLETVELINPSTDKVYYEEIHLFFNDHDTGLNNREIIDFPVKYTDIATIFPEILSAWYKQNQQDLLPISNILLECLVDKPIFEEIQFLTAFQGAEAFHRRFIQDTATLKTEHKAYMQTLLSHISDPDLIKKLKNQLTFAYEMTARQRFAEIIPILKPIALYITDEQIEMWIKEMVNSRNYLTHLDPSGLSKKAGSRKLMHYTNLLKASLTVLIMTRLGIPISLLQGIEMKYRQDFQHLMKSTQI